MLKSPLKIITNNVFQVCFFAILLFLDILRHYENFIYNGLGTKLTYLILGHDFRREF